MITDFSSLRSTENLLHRLFVCIAGVADQLQTNFAADLRQILRAVFLINCSQEEEEKPAIIDETKSKDNQQDLFEFRASEENVIRQSNSNHGSIGSQQSICSAEEVNAESDDAVFEEENEVETEEQEQEEEIIETRDDNEIDRRRKRRYGNRLTGRSISLSDDATTASNGLQDEDEENEDHHTSRRNYSISTSPSTSHPQSPPKWIPDHQVPKCMSCESQFTAFRRRHHCRNCGKLMRQQHLSNFHYKEIFFLGGIFCGVCSSCQRPLPKFGLTKPVRVCRACFVRESTA